MLIKLCTFNCRGLQDFVKRRKIFHFLRNTDCEIILLQETHCGKDDEKFWKSQWGEHCWFTNFSSNSRGVAILIRNSISVRMKSSFYDPQGRFLILNCFLNDIHLTILNIYAPNNDDPNFFLETFAEMDKFENSSLILGGDFNATVSDIDYQGTRHRHSNVRASNMISDLMEEYNLIDVWRHFHPTQRQYTRHQKSPQVLSRLDYILVSSDFIGNCVKSKISPGIQSDHSIVSIHFNDNSPKRGKGYWKLNCYYLYHDAEYINLIKEKISEFKKIHKDSECNPNTQWDALKCVITGISMEYFARKKKERKKEKDHLNKEIEIMKSQLSENVSKNKQLLTTIADLEDKLDKLYDFETKGLIIRSRVRWLEEGEKNSKYFCNLENRSWQKKTISTIKDGEGKLSSDPDKILKEIHDFYENLYSNSQNQNSSDDNFQDLFNKINIPKLTDSEKELLEKPLSKQEIVDVIKSMKTNKAPGFDGLPIEFYVVFWPDICDMLLDSFNFSLRSGMMSLSQRNGIITLLPKNRDDLLIKNYRPITLLTVDYKILAKCLAERIKCFINCLIHTDQSAFLKGRNISHNVRLIFDIIEYTEANNIPGAILLLDIEKAFDSVNHNFLFQTLKQFNFGDNFLSWIETLYNERTSYVLNNGFLTNRISMQRGIFQGCPISPYLFLFVIEILALSIRQNDNLNGMKIQDHEVKISLFADDSVCFIDGSRKSFDSLFDVLNQFGKYSGCKLNLSKTEAIWIGSKKGCQDFPMSNQGITWRNSTFKSLGINFSLDLSLIFDLNYKEKLKQMTQTINCWRMRNLSLIGKICVIKSLVLPQLIYLFSVLSIKTPQKYFNELNSLFFKFIWNGGKDRVKRKYVYSDYIQGGLKMIDPWIFSLAQKMYWVKLLLNDDYVSAWKSIEVLALEKIHKDNKILWKAFAPESILKSLENSQIADSLRTWYVYREYATLESYHTKFSEIGTCQILWFNRLICSKSKRYFYYESWDNKNISSISDLLNPPLPNHKLFEELILDFDIPRSDRRKYNFLIKHIPEEWLDVPFLYSVNIHDSLVSSLLAIKKVPKYAYKIMNVPDIPEKRYDYWKSQVTVPEETIWEKVHNVNFTCTIDTRLRSFYFKIFHKTIALNDFLFKINRKESPNCVFCEKKEETIVHLFCECEKVTPLWKYVTDSLARKGNNINLTNFEKLFGIITDKFVTYILLIVKYYIYICKFRGDTPNVESLKNFIKSQRETEYYMAKKRNKLALHFKKWRFEL